MDRKGLEINMSREEVGMDDISKRLVHNKVCNVTVKRNKNKLENALAVIQELVKSGRLHAEGEVETIRTPERLKEYREKKLSFTKLEDVYKRALQAAKKGREFTFHWRGGYLTREVLADLVDQIQAAGKTRDKKAIITLNWPQAVLRFHFAEQQAEGKVFIEEVNEGEKL